MIPGFRDLRTEAVRFACELGCYQDLIDAIRYSLDFADLRDTARRAYGPGSEPFRSWMLANLETTGNQPPAPR